MAVFLGLTVAMTYGAADFFGGLAAKRASNWSVVVATQCVGLVGIAALVLVDGTPLPAGGDLAYGAAASCVGVVGVGLLYLGLARGPMGVVAPITATGAAVVPVAWALLEGERPSPVALVGVGVALVAVGLIAREAAPEEHAESTRIAPSTLAAAIAAGIAFGAFFILLTHASEDSGFWPIF